MITQELGQLEFVHVRTIWPDEARDFTPWLAKNLGCLGAELGMSLELVEQEAPAGRFKLDILAKDADSGVLIAIENQLEWTNHNHLGQLLTYAGNLDNVRTLIWVGPDFLPEHRAALEWLNKWTKDEIQVYGVQVVVGCIGDSLPAPVFKTIVSPPNWTSSSDRLPRRESFHAPFNQRLVDELHDAGVKRVPPDDGGWSDEVLSFSTGHGGILYGVQIGDDRKVSVFLQIESAETSRSKRIYDALRKHCKEIADEIPGAEWWPYDDVLNMGIVMNATEAPTVEVKEKRDDAIRDWIRLNLVNLRNTVQPRLDTIMAELYPTE